MGSPGFVLHVTPKLLNALPEFHSSLVVCMWRTESTFRRQELQTGHTVMTIITAFTP